MSDNLSQIDWVGLMGEYEESGTSMGVFCEERGIELVKFKSKRKSYQNVKKRSSFVPVVLEAESKSARIEFPSGVVISFNF